MRHATYASRLLSRCLRQHVGSKRQIGQLATASAATGDAAGAVSSVSAREAATTVSGNGCRATVLDGRTVAAAWEKELLADVGHLTELLGRPPGLGVVLVGSRPDSMLYVAKKQEACQKAGMQTFVHHLPEAVSQAQLEAAVSHACSDSRVDGVLIQLPLPRHLSEEAVMEVLDPRKDVDGFHPINMGRMLMRGRGVRLVPATPLGCMELLRRSGVEVQGKTCVVLGDSNIVGTPLAAMLRDRGAAAVTICHRRSYREWFEDQEQVQRTRAAAAVCLPRLPGPSRPPPHMMPNMTAEAEARADANADAAVDAASADGASVAQEGFQSYQLPHLTRSADILVVAVGHPELVRADWVRPGAVVIDVGINVVSTLPRARSPPGGGGAAGPGDAAANAAAAFGADTSAALDRAAAASLDGAGQGLGPAAARSGRAGGGSCASGSSSCNGLHEPGSGRGDCGSGGGSSSSSYSHAHNGWPTNGGPSSGRNVSFQVVGDVAFEEVSQVAGAITPVPGGIGPMTIAAVLHNTLKAAKYRVGLEPW